MRQWVLDAAAQVFAEFGYGAGTTNRIADRAGVSIGSLYRYFPNKDAILRALMDRHLEAGAALYQERLAAGLPPPLDDALRLIVRATIDNHRDDPRLHRVLFEEAPRAPSLLARLHESEELAVTLVAAVLENHPEVAVADPGLSARVVVVTIESMVHRLMTASNPVPAQRLEDETVDLLAAYLRHRGDVRVRR
nr:TetR/AcrR family transcriptional regulator [Nocardia yunnanensis]